jgi:catechol 2,3-dioxygenase-like lactoylglutathione lyase family enzyme
MPRLYRVILPVPDIEQAQAFYEHVLGIAGHRVSPERHYFDCDGTILACFDPTRFHEKPEATPNPEHIYIAVDDLEGCLRRCTEAGASIEVGIDSYPWGETSFYVEDPFGNPVCFVDRKTIFTGASGPAPS